MCGMKGVIQGWDPGAGSRSRRKRMESQVQELEAGLSWSSAPLFLAEDCPREHKQEGTSQRSIYSLRETRDPQGQ